MRMTWFLCLLNLKMVRCVVILRARIYKKTIVGSKELRWACSSFSNFRSLYYRGGGVSQPLQLFDEALRKVFVWMNIVVFESSHDPDFRNATQRWKWSGVASSVPTSIDVYIWCSPCKKLNCLLKNEAKWNILRRDTFDKQFVKIRDCLHFVGKNQMADWFQGFQTLFALTNKFTSNVCFRRHLQGIFMGEWLIQCSCGKQ